MVVSPGSPGRSLRQFSPVVPDECQNGFQDHRHIAGPFGPHFGITALAGAAYAIVIHIQVPVYETLGSHDGQYLKDDIIMYDLLTEHRVVFSQDGCSIYGRRAISQAGTITAVHPIKGIRVIYPARFHVLNPDNLLSPGGDGFICPVQEDQVCLRLVQHSKQSTELLRVEPVIRVQKEQVLSFRLLHSPVPCSPMPAIFLVNDPEQARIPGFVFPGDLGRPVGRFVIDDDNIQKRPLLFRDQQGAKALPDIWFHAINGNDDG